MNNSSQGEPISQSWHKTTETRKNLEERKGSLLRNLEAMKVELKEIEAELYEIRTRELHIAEIYRLAAFHLPRLRRQTGEGLILQDVAELEKWISRAHSNDGLKNIVEALTELQKYQPIEITKSVYALVQKIIIEGAYKEKRTTRTKKS